MPSSVTPGPGTTAPAPSMSSTCASTSSRWALPRRVGRGLRAALPLSQEGASQAESTPLARQVSVYLQNWSHVLSYVSKAESTPEIAEVTPASHPLCFLGPCARTVEARAGLVQPGLPLSLSGWGRARGRARMWRPGAHVSRFLLQQRGERDSQTQAILTKLKCAAGEVLGRQAAQLTPALGVACACRRSGPHSQGGGPSSQPRKRPSPAPMAPGGACQAPVLGGEASVRPVAGS